MGFLVDSGETYNFEESKKVQQTIKELGIIQFLKLYKQNESRQNTINGCQLVWGDEIEFMLINLNEQDQVPRLQINSKHIFDKFHSYPEEMKQNQDTINFETKYEYGSWMIETTPDRPFNSINSINQLVENFKKRRQEIATITGPSDKLLYLSVFPMLGVRDYYDNIEKNKQRKISSTNEMNDLLRDCLVTPKIDTLEDFYLQQSLQEQNSQTSLKKYSTESSLQSEILNTFSESIFIHDKIITQHQRFYTLTQNIRQRRGEKVQIKMPLYMDKKTSLIATESEPYPKQIYMDAMAFGMGNSCLQITLAARNMKQARFLYDQLAIISPIFLALSAASPIFKGKLADVDTRWDAICQSVDDRSAEERDPKSEKYIPKSRYNSISKYISDSPLFKKEYNDLKFPVNQQIIDFTKQKQKEFGLDLDDTLLQHLGFLFARDALVIFKNKVENIDEFSTEHFENLQSTNWNSVRFKPAPSLNSDLPWRVEFRTMDLQITDEENALLIYLVLAIALMLYSPELKLNFYVPISVVDKNFVKASKRNALIEEKFLFRRNILNAGEPEIIELTLKELFFGNAEFIGIHKLLNQYLKEYLSEEQQLFNQYEFLFNFLKDRLDGKKLSTASWMRQFVLNHPDYKQDSIITEKIAYDLLNNFEQIQSKKVINDNFLSFIPNFKK